MHLGFTLGESQLLVARRKLGDGGIQKEPTNRPARGDAHSRGQGGVELTRDPTHTPLFYFLCFLSRPGASAQPFQARPKRRHCKAANGAAHGQRISQCEPCAHPFMRKPGGRERPESSGSCRLPGQTVSLSRRSAASTLSRGHPPLGGAWWDPVGDGQAPKKSARPSGHSSP